MRPDSAGHGEHWGTTRRYLCAGGLLLSLVLLNGTCSSAAADEVNYLRDIKPVLKARCWACHGSLKQEAGLRLDSGQLIRQGGDSGPAVVEGEPQQSLLLQRVTAEPDERMPPEGDPLSPEETKLLRAWVAFGAHSPADEVPESDPQQHWAFLPPQRPLVPNVDRPEWNGNPVDAFVAAQHVKLGLEPVPVAPPEILLRRASLDLIGLPPTPHERSEFLADRSSDRWINTVDRLLDSPHYGERWGRHWMDVWRYSDWYGRRQVGDVRNSYPHIWRWRDWIIQSLNEDKGYDQMVREMLAADELYPDDDTRLPALGFIVRNWFSLNYDTWKQDLVEHTGKAFLGLRLNCCHCHDHKYDPVTQEEYFRFRAFFEPLELRHDRVPGGPALVRYVRYKPGSGASLKPIKDGLPRVYDLYPDEKTYMYRLGDTRDRFDRPPVQPGVPDFIRGDGARAELVTLPVVARFPGLKPFVLENEVSVQEELRVAAREKMKQARADELASRNRLAKAEAELQELRSQYSADTVTPRRADDVTAEWRFEGANDDTGFLADSSGNGHGLIRVVGDDPPVALFALSDTERGRSFFGRMPDGVANNQAAQFRQDQSYSYLATQSGDRTFPADVFTLEAFANFFVSKKNYNRTIVDYDGSWSLLHRGLTADTFELRVRYFNADGLVRDIATADVRHGPQKMILNTGHDYYLCLIMDREQVTLLAADLTEKSPLQSAVFARSTPQQDFTTLAKPAVTVPIRIGNSDGTGRVNGLIDEVRLTCRPLTMAQLARSVGLSANAAIQNSVANVTILRNEARLRTLAVRILELQEQAATAQIEALNARRNADERKYASDSASAEMIRAAVSTAARAEHASRIAAAELRLVQAETGKLKESTRETPDPAQWQKVEREFTTAEKVFAELKAAKVDETVYTPMGPEYPATSTGRRRALANWLTSRRNPLTARVAVNHIWMRHFGRPLVESVFDFGRSGTRPSHPQLLDWLAAELMDSNWSMKRLHRLILSSRTWRLSSRTTQSTRDNEIVDRDNVYRWKCDRRRLEAEVVRDSVLFVSGRLDRSIGGPEIPSADELESNRRSLYFTTYPEAGGAMKFLTLFDPPDPRDCYRRIDSVVPQQALALANSRLVEQQAEALFELIAVELNTRIDSPDQFVAAAFTRILCRLPTASEGNACKRFLREQKQLYVSISPVMSESDIRARACRSLLKVLLNHNDFITVH